MIPSRAKSEAFANESEGLNWKGRTNFVLTAFPDNLQNRMLRLAEDTKTRKSVQAVLITTHGLILNEYSDIVQSVVTTDDLF